jgi:hypothetical protein
MHRAAPEALAQAYYNYGIGQEQQLNFAIATFEAP